MHEAIFTSRTIRRRERIARYSYSYTTSESVFDWTGDLAGFAPLCCKTDAIQKAVGFAETVNKSEGSKTEAALYVIGVEGMPVAKLGVTTQPASRLSTLQGAHWAPLYIHALIWGPTRKAETVEQTALQAAEEMGVRLMGEWVAMNVDEALELALKAGRYRNTPLCDSMTWLSNWDIRLTALRAHRASWGLTRPVGGGIQPS